MNYRNLLVLALSSALLPTIASAKDITVGPGNHTDYHTIQAAINAAHPGDKINVQPGTYLEQLTVGAGKDNININTGNAKISPPATMTSGSLITISVAKSVTIHGFTISGPLPSSAVESAVTAFGIYVRDGASANISNNYITQMWDVIASNRGVQNGGAIHVGRQFEGTSGSAVIENNTIDHFQKGGIVVDNTGSNAVISNNTVSGEGPILWTAQNGIQVGRGATGVVQNNDVNNLSYAGPYYSASGILVFSTSNVNVSGNHVTACDLGVAFADVTKSEIDHNRITDGMYGIDVDEFSTGSQMNEIDHNDSLNNSQEGVYVSVDSVNNLFDHNNFRDNAFLDAEDDSVGSGTAGTGNTWEHNKVGTDNHGGGLGK
jgi:parallel beta-helix repeat protein